MWLKKLTEVLPQKSEHALYGTFDTALANGSGVAPTAKRLTFELDRSNPITAIRIYVKCNVDVAATAMTPDGIGAILKNIEFSRKSVGALPGTNQKRSSVTVWNTPGIDALQRRYHVAKLDRKTYTAIGSYAVRTAFVLCYHLDLADDQVVDPLRAITACPVHLDSANPILTLDFAAQSDMEASGGTAFTMKHLTAEVHVIRADMSPQVTQQIINAGGFLEHETLTRDFSMSQSAAQRLEIESPGEYSSLMLTTFSSATARGDVLASGSPTFELKEQNKTRREFTLDGLRSENSDSIVETTTDLFTYNAHLDFIGDQLGNAENNLGSLLNANLEELNGQKTVLTFKGGGSNMKIRWTGRRYLTPIGSRRFAFANAAA